MAIVARRLRCAGAWHVGACVALLAAPVGVLAVAGCRREVSEKGATARTTRIAVVQLLAHPDVEAITRGLEEELASSGYAQGRQFEMLVRNAQNQPSVLSQIALDLKNREIDLLVPIFTPTAQAIKKEFPNTPTIFAAVTDPVGAGIVGSLERPGDRITGVSDQWPVDRQLALIREVLPKARKLGIPYNPGEQNSQTTFAAISAEGPKRGFEVIPAPVSSVNDLLAACATLKKRADVLYTANDITVASGLEAVIKFARESRIPLFAGDATAVRRGAIGTVSQSYYGIGRLAGQLAVRVLRGANPGDIPVVISKEATITLNPKSAEQMGVRLAPGLLRRAQIVAEGAAVGSPSE